MKKEVPDITPKSNTTNSINKNSQVKYNQPEKFKLSDITKSFPKELIPTSRYNEIFGFVFLAGILISIFFLDFGAFFSTTEEELSINVGFPFTFFSINTEVDDTSFPISWSGLIYDILVYLFVAYLIEVVFNLISAIHPTNKGEKAKLYNLPKINQNK